MRKYLVSFLIISALFASCTKDDDTTTANTTPITAADLTGTWELQKIQASDVTVKGIDITLVNELKEGLPATMNESQQTFTFNGNMICTLTEKQGDKVTNTLQGAYTILNNRLNTILISLSENGAKYYYNVGIEKKDDKFFFVYDKISYLFTYGELLKNAKTEDEKKIFQSKIARATTLISAIRCPILMVKK